MQPEAESIVEPGAYATSHTNPTVVLICVRSGALGLALQHGSATATWFTQPAIPPANDPLLSGESDVQRQLLPGSEITLRPRDCVSFDHFVTQTSHASWNASDGPTKLIEARLVKTGEPYVVFVDPNDIPTSP